VARPLLIFVALAAAVVLFVVRLIPPTVIDQRLATLTKGAVHLIDTEGTVWDARGVLAAGTARIPLAWRIDPSALVRREIRMHFIRGDGSSSTAPKGEVAIRANAVELSDVDATIPAGFIGAFIGAGSGSNAASLIGGDIRLDTALLEWAPPASRGDVRLMWRGAWLTAPGSVEPVALGDIAATFSAAGDRISGPVSNTGGDLGVGGTIALTAGGGLQLSLLLTPRRADDRQLARALSMIGAPEGTGWRVEWRLPLR